MVFRGHARRVRDHFEFEVARDTNGNFEALEGGDSLFTVSNTEGEESGYVVLNPGGVAGTAWEYTGLDIESPDA